MSDQENFPKNDFTRNDKEVMRSEIEIEETSYVDKWIHEQMDGYDPQLEEEIDERIAELKKSNPLEIDDSKSDNQLRSDIKREIGIEIFKKELKRRVDKRLKSQQEE